MTMYQKEFFHSKAHAILGCVCLGLICLSGHIFGAIIGITAYVIGIINIPDTKMFMNIVDNEQKELERIAQDNKAEEFIRKRDRQITSLSKESQAKYYYGAGVCKSIEEAINGCNNQDFILAKIDELMFTYLKILSIYQFLERFIEGESSENLEATLKRVNIERDNLVKDISELKDQSVIDHKQKLLMSIDDKVGIVKKRVDRLKEARNNIEIVTCEEDRIVEQLKLIRADAIATKNAEGLSIKIDATVEHLDQTNKWLSEMKDFGDINESIPNSENIRVGYGNCDGISSYIDNPSINKNIEDMARLSMSKKAPRTRTVRTA